MSAMRLSIRLSEQERGLLEAYAKSADLGVSTYARQVLREHVGLSGTGGALQERIEDVERRVSRLEGMAGL
jgi:hypothetical protein